MRQTVQVPVTYFMSLHRGNDFEQAIHNGRVPRASVL